ncbi:MAG: alpha/beta hydrolase, partial [Oscillospiraceae bacterium]
SRLLDKLSFGGYTKRIAEVRTSSDWLSRDTKNVDKYIADPFCGFIFTASGFKDVSTMMRFVSTKQWANSIKKELPIFLISGEADPVGEYGVGVKKVAQMLKNSGVKDSTLKLYAGGRHEILNETNYKDVYEDIFAWLLVKVK